MSGTAGFKMERAAASLIQKVEPIEKVDPIQNVDAAQKVKRSPRRPAPFPVSPHLPLYSARDLRFCYSSGRQEVPAIRSVTLELQRPCLVCLQGPSGSGKTTLLNLLGLVEPVQEGSLFFAGRDVRNLRSAEANELRRFHIGYVFQSFLLMNVLRADENVEYFLARQGLPRGERRRRVRDALERVGLWEQRSRRPLEMSGGQRQKLAVARALAKRPWVILADEPTANLDQASGRQVVQLLCSLHQERGVSVIMASHDPMVQASVPAAIVLTDGVASGVRRGRTPC